MRALFRSKGLDRRTHTEKEKKKKKTALGYLQMVFALRWTLTPDRDSICRLCVRTHSHSCATQRCSDLSELGAGIPDLKRARSLDFKAIPLILYLAALAAAGANSDIEKETASTSCRRSETLETPIAAFCRPAGRCKSKTGCWPEAFIETSSLIIAHIFQVPRKIFFKHSPCYLSPYMLSAAQQANFGSPNCRQTLVAAGSVTGGPRLRHVRMLARQNLLAQRCLSHFSDTITAFAKSLASCTTLRGFSQQHGSQASLWGPVPKAPLQLAAPPATRAFPHLCASSSGDLRLLCSSWKGIALPSLV